MPIPVSTPLELIAIVEFLRVSGVLAEESVSPAFVSVTPVSVNVSPKSLFKNLFVLVSPVPPLFTGTAVSSTPLAVSPVVTLD